MIGVPEAGGIAPETKTKIQCIADEDTCSFVKVYDGTTTFTRMFDDYEQAVLAFSVTVDEIVDEFTENSIEYDVTYEEGESEIELVELP